MLRVLIVDAVGPLFTYWNVFWDDECIGWVIYSTVGDHFRFSEAINSFHKYPGKVVELSDKAISVAMNDIATAIIEKDILRS